MPKVYIAEFVGGDLDIVEVEKVKDTPKQIHIDKKSVKTIWKTGKWVHLYLPGRVDKSTFNIFDTEDAAVRWGIEKWENYVYRLQMNIADAHVNMARLMTHYLIGPSEQKPEETQEVEAVG